MAIWDSKNLRKETPALREGPVASSENEVRGAQQEFVFSAPARDFFIYETILICLNERQN
jgi:hypothetical protein